MAKTGMTTVRKVYRNSNGKAYLNSCANAILFTIGDNDTFPLWYAQEIEHVRTDIKIVNTSFYDGWYIDQMKTKTYEAEPLPISFT
jgi:alpha-D-ribose 1-methylphosphonate 5-triphosphate synthase subunit PhnH